MPSQDRKQPKSSQSQQRSIRSSTNSQSSSNVSSVQRENIGPSQSKKGNPSQSSQSQRGTSSKSSQSHRRSDTKPSQSQRRSYELSELRKAELVQKCANYCLLAMNKRTPIRKTHVVSEALEGEGKYLPVIWNDLVSCLREVSLLSYQSCGA